MDISHSCVRCERDIGIRTRGLCGGCYQWARRNGELDSVALPSLQPGPINDPHDHDCPSCPDGGMVAPYEADEVGRVLSRICLGRGHTGARRLT